MEHCSHVWFFSSLWIKLCLLNTFGVLNDLLHCLQLNGFSPVWTITWDRRPLLLDIAILHLVHLYSLSFIWTCRMCSFILLASVNPLWRSLHMWCFFPCILVMCCFNLLDLPKDFSHKEQFCVLLLWKDMMWPLISLTDMLHWMQVVGKVLWTCVMCCFILIDWPKRLSHFKHLIVLSLWNEVICCFKCLNDFLHWPHWLGKPEWKSAMCFFLKLRSKKFLKQWNVELLSNHSMPTLLIKFCFSIIFLKVIRQLKP